MKVIVRALILTLLFLPACSTSPDYDVNDYQISYLECTHDKAEVLAQSGSTRPEAAARWLSETMKAGPHREGSYQGCLDALMGKPTRHPRN
jgi:hypothetical protein